MDYSELPWNFEAFRRFIDYKTLQKAASVLCLFDGRKVIGSPRDLEEFQTTLDSRTGLEWLPDRNVSDDILFNVEGNVFRNKARVFSSFFLLNPKLMESTGCIVTTKFGKALGWGFIPEQEFYNTIVMKFQYPHPVYDENWSAWNDANVKLKPFLFILQILYKLHQIDKNHDWVSVKEFAEFAHSNPFHEKAGEIAQNIYNSRINEQVISRERTDRIERKIGDIFGFLCMTGLCYYIDSNIKLNLVKKSNQENVYFYEKRNQESRLEEINSLINI